MTKEAIGVVKWLRVSEIYIDILVSFMVNLNHLSCKTYDILQVGKARNNGFIFPKPQWSFKSFYEEANRHQKLVFRTIVLL